MVEMGILERNHLSGQLAFNPPLIVTVLLEGLFLRQDEVK